MEPNKKRNVALESTREWQVDRATQLLLLEKRVARCRRDADYFDRIFLLLLSIQIGADFSVDAPAALGHRRIFARILNALSERVTVRPKFFGKNFINDGHLWTRLRCFRFGERAAADHPQ